ncbi:MAG: hypothetical protein MZV65_46940 [Chromatiales bacterium]|nr:hypothetical protein [Chromatiales bacterium]
MRRVDGTAKSVRVIGKGDKERPGAAAGQRSAQVFGFWLKEPAGRSAFR